MQAGATGTGDDGSQGSERTEGSERSEDSHVIQGGRGSRGSHGGRLQKMRWTLNRLRTMSGAEIVWRLGRAGRIRLERTGIGLATPPRACLQSFGRCWVARLPVELDSQPYCDAADRILAGRFRVFALHDAPVGFPPDWNRDPKSGLQAPLVHGKSLDYRDSALVGDIKYLWEPNRHYELVTLAQAYVLSGQMRYADACRSLLSSWFDQCPYPLGQGWSSALENAVRLVNWAIAWHLLGGVDAPLFLQDGGAGFRRRWLDAVYRHCHFIAHHLSMHSSANNHLLGEYMGLYIGAATWPCWDQSADWRQHGRQGVEAEALRQNGADGVNREQATWYHHEVADMMLLCGLVGRAERLPFSREYWQRLERMLEFIHALMDVGGHMPMIGDADDAMPRWSCEAGFDAYRSLLATGGILFERPDFRRKAGCFDHKSRWLLGDACAAAFRRADDAGGAPGQPVVPLRQEFAEGGYYILGSGFDTAAEIRIVADAGPLGYLGIAAHGHADALAFTLSAGGRPLLIDPGTFAYHTQRHWRDYFRGTAAHNTVRVDGLDQSVIGGNFMWLQKARARCERFDSTPLQDCFTGSHDGYQRLRDPLVHRRTLVFLKQEKLLIVEDLLECRQAHAIEISWHFSDDCSVTVGDAGATITSANLSLEMQLPDTCGSLALTIGRDAPPLGWISRCFDEKQPSPSLVWRESIHGTTRLVTRFRISIGCVRLHPDHMQSPDASCGGDGG